jgi:hypothetical protein
MAGLKGSIFESGHDTPYNFLGLFNSSMVDAGVGGVDTPETGGHVIQIVSNLGNGLSIGGGLEDLDSDSDITAVGVLKYAGDGFEGHASFAAAELIGGSPTEWMVHAGLTADMDPVKLTAAIHADNTTAGTMYWNALASVLVSLDMFEIALSAEADDSDVDAMQFGLGGSIGATVSEGVKINVGGRYWQEEDTDTVWQVAAGLSASVTETITATAEVGMVSESNGPTSFFYGKGGLAWAPGGGFTSSVAGEASSNGAYKATFKAAKTIK